MFSFVGSIQHSCASFAVISLFTGTFESSILSQSSFPRAFDFMAPYSADREADRLPSHPVEQESVGYPVLMLWPGTEEPDARGIDPSLGQLFLVRGSKEEMWMFTQPLLECEILPGNPRPNHF
jgi:hypothetical protein